MPLLQLGWVLIIWYVYRFILSTKSLIGFISLLVVIPSPSSNQRIISFHISSSELIYKSLFSSKLDKASIPDKNVYLISFDWKYSEKISVIDDREIIKHDLVKYIVETYTENTVYNFYKRKCDILGFYKEKDIDNAINDAYEKDYELLIVMRSIYLQFSKNLDKNIDRQVFELNKLVLQYCVPNIYSEILQYNGYLKAISTNIVPLDRSINIIK